MSEVKGKVFIYFPEKYNVNDDYSEEVKKTAENLTEYFILRNKDVIMLALNKKSIIINENDIKEDKSEANPIVICISHGGWNEKGKYNIDYVSKYSIIRNLNIISKQTCKKDLCFIPLVCCSYYFIKRENDLEKKDRKKEELKNEYILKKIEEKNINKMINDIKTNIGNEITEQLKFLNNKLEEESKSSKKILRNNIKSYINSEKNIYMLHKKIFHKINKELNHLEEIKKFGKSKEYKHFIKESDNINSRSIDTNCNKEILNSLLSLIKAHNIAEIDEEFAETLYKFNSVENYFDNLLIMSFNNPLTYNNDKITRSKLPLKQEYDDMSLKFVITKITKKDKKYNQIEFYTFQEALDHIELSELANSIIRKTIENAIQDIDQMEICRSHITTLNKNIVDTIQTFEQNNEQKLSTLNH